MRNLMALLGAFALTAQPWGVSGEGLSQSIATAAPGKGGPGKGAGGKGANGKGAGKSKSKKAGKSSGANIDVQHPDGTRERIRKNRYIMKDAKGRTIVNRPAKRPDRLRLKRFVKRPG
jgi:hypothetical protein